MTDEEKWKLLEETPFLDAENPQLRLIAAHLWEAAWHRPMLYLHLAHTMARDGIDYLSDITQFGGEDIAGVTRRATPDDAIDALRRGKDDCDAKARLFVALALIKGFTAKMAPLWENGQLKHVYGKVEIDGEWQPVETILSRAIIGDEPKSVPKEANGHWLKSGQKIATEGHFYE